MNNPHIIPLDVIQLVYAYGLILISLGIARLQQIGHEQQLLWASKRLKLPSAWEPLHGNPQNRLSETPIVPR